MWHRTPSQTGKVCGLAVTACMDAHRAATTERCGCGAPARQAVRVISVDTTRCGSVHKRDALGLRLGLGLRLR